MAEHERQAASLLQRYPQARVRVFEFERAHGYQVSVPLGDFDGLQAAILAVSNRDLELMFDVQIEQPDGSIECLKPGELAELVALVQSEHRSA